MAIALDDVAHAGAHGRNTLLLAWWTIPILLLTLTLYRKGVALRDPK